MSTRLDIITIADALLREKGYNAFSFSDISSKLNIKNASVHYHFPTKTDLGLAIITEHRNRLESQVAKYSAKHPLQKLQAFLSIYEAAKSQKQICLVGSLATDLYTVDEPIQQELRKLVNDILAWVTSILEEGKQKKVFHFNGDSRTKALMIITNMLAAVQLTRLTTQKDFNLIKQAIINDLTNDR
jgi:TetR/AcrR family transcriptional regulator, transcriptional repressor for nem operon